MMRGVRKVRHVWLDRYVREPLNYVDNVIPGDSTRVYQWSLEDCMRVCLWRRR